MLLHKEMNENKTRKVILCWVRDHIGINGNELADEIAKLGHTSNKSTLYPLHKEPKRNTIMSY